MRAPRALVCCLERGLAGGAFLHFKSESHVTVLRVLGFSAALLAFALPRVATAQDAAELLLRLDRLEAENRRLNGQIEQLQFELRRQDDQFKRFQADSDLRFKDLEGGKGPRPGQKRSEIEEPRLPPATTAPSRTAGTDGNGAGYPSVPLAGTPGSIAARTVDGSTGLAPGPRPLGGAVTTLSDRPVRPGGGAVANPDGPLIEDTPYPLNGKGGRSVSTTASIPTGSAKEVYEAGRAALDRGEFEQAELDFREFLKAHARDKLVPDAMYGLGEAYYARRKYTEAAEQYLNLTTKYGQSHRAPEAMLKLGMSLRALGSAQEACATLGEVVRRYPNASGSVKAAVARERSRSKCAG